ncbi:hypothetical protein CHS0354_008706 [Potamilus streckersoni]|uniref:EGF-like domain-containing protein n=1 Tax=Potamilus streckersoni TaxID=2493646 RepID=A0AAE0SBY7_9BIVA|nr:hypothetical protein CHS0354_008706 [Potamilus streckersoni]
MGFGNYGFFILCLITILSTQSEALQPGGAHVIAIYYSESVSYKTCGRWWRGCKTRYRNVQRVRYECESGWSSKGTEDCPEPLCGYYSPVTDPGACNINTNCNVITLSGPICQSGGKCSSPYSCVNCNLGHYVNRGFWGYCALCQQIAHCKYAECTRYGDSRCKYCEGEYTGQYGWYAYSRFRDNGLSCQLACSWRFGSRCFPGNCSDTTLASCLCASGYSGTDCATIDIHPDILSMEMTFEFSGDTSTEKEIIEGEDGHISWTSLNVFTEVNAKVKAAFKQNFMYSPPSYINENSTRAGIIRMSLSLYLYRDNTQKEIYLYTSCTPDRAESDNCFLRESLDEKSSKWKSYLSFDHKDRFKLVVSATNGGKVYYYNRDRGGQLEYYDLVGKTTTKILYLGIDRISPFHCCTQQPFYVVDVTTNPRVTVQWDGWLDDLSGIDHYEIDIFLLSISSGEHNDESVLESGLQGIECAACRNITVQQTEIELLQKGPYAVFLVAFDKAKNHARARRIIMFDDDPIINFTHGSRTIVKTASVETNYTWITRNTSVVEVDWKGRFISKNTDQGKWLNKVKDISLDRAYDDYEGKRTVDRKDNVRGIVKFTASYKTVYKENITEYSMTTVSNIYLERTNLPVLLQDGMRLSIHVRAYDIFDSYLEETVNVTADFSPPVIQNLWLTKGDRLNISVHNMREFSNLMIEWELYDFHSGIHEVSWRLFDNHTSLEHELLHGTDILPPQGNANNMSECTQKYGPYPRGANCYCTPFHGCYHKHFQVKPVIVSAKEGLFQNGSKGLHDGDYYFQVIALNGAFHRTVETMKITVDTSQPHQGIVHEGILGNPEVDYQNILEIHAYWSDFFDKESGVMFYRYGFGKSCLTKETFLLDYNGHEQLIETYETKASYRAPEEGTYYITVAAYNHALDSSAPVCSDGVTIDTTSPIIKELKVERMRIRQALVISSADSHVWYINRDRELYSVPDADSTCIDKATSISEQVLKQFPVKHYANGTSKSVLPSIACKAGPLRHILGTLTAIHNLTMSWKTESGPGGVHDYEVGLSSSNTMFPDRTDFFSTKQHTSAFIQEPNIMIGERFYILIRTTSKSSVMNVQVFGPFIVDTTSPTVNGGIAVHLRGQYLEASWSGDTFIDEEDSSPLTFQFAIGYEKFGTDVMAYTDVQSGGSCNATITPVTCSAVRVDRLHWALHEDRIYYITVKAENTAGFVTLMSSDAYLHNTKLPTEGVVVDIDANNTRLFQTIDDIDFQTSTSEVSGRWYGFHHSHLDIVYRVCVGEKEDTATTIRCVDISNSSSYTFTNLNLQTLKKYYYIVTAITGAGNVTQFSDGVTIVKEGMQIWSVNIVDGPLCNSSEDMQSVGFSHHSVNTVTYCKGDIDFQSSTNHIEAHWTIPENVTKFISVAHWKLQEKFPLTDYWKDLSEYEHLPTLHELKGSELILQAGKTYRVAIELCADQFCYQPIFSDGVTVIPNPPITGGIDVFYNISEKKIRVTVENFRDSDLLNEEDALSVIDYYEWAFTDNSHIDRTLTPWTKVENVHNVNKTSFAFEVTLNGSIQFSKCWRISVRGVTFAKLSSALSTDIKSCDDINNVRPNIVIDAVGQPIASPDGSDTAERGQVIQLEKNSDWLNDDMDYTPYTNIISAVWPTLRYKEYKWAVIEETLLDPNVFYNTTQNLYLVDPCSHPYAVQCGTTVKEYVNAFFDDGIIQHGKRYIVCIHAEETELLFEKWTMLLPNISSCSDGLTVDLTPPLKNSVWIGPTKDTKYQSSQSDMSISWNSFVDIEEHGFHVHSSGLQKYEVAIGTSPYGVDILTYKAAGLVNHVTFHNLRLQNGHAYYASVKGYDHVDHTSVSVSLPVIVDTTPPIRTDRKIAINGRHITSVSSVNPCWTGLFYDRESGISKYEWSIGSRPGYENIMQPTTVYTECGIMSENSNVTMKEGNAYYVSVKAHNGVGLRTVVSSWAFIVDASPPVAGYIEDGPTSLEEDTDFQTNYSQLSAKWKGFLDPHTAIKEYYVSFGTCPMCDDVLQRQSVGIRFDISLPNLRLSQGRMYYCTVTACNTADLCTTIASDGVIIDSTPPVRGRVLDGREGHDIAYQSSRSFLAATWFGFWDSQSGLSHYVWRAGTTKGTDDILQPTNLHLSDMASIPSLPDTKLLPVGKKIYITIRAYNKAGLFAESSSNGFIVDISAPNITKRLELVSRGSLRPSTLVYRSAMKIQWEVVDMESFIDRQYLSIQSHIGGDFNLSSTKVNGIARDYTFTGLDLHDGSYYDVTLISCNGAGLCSNCSLSGILMDSSPPKPGTFAISTDHASQPRREPEGWMTWSVFYINLAWLGFTDVHSGIDTYLVNVGSSYMGSDLNKEPQTPKEIKHEANTTHYADEGYVQMARIDTRSLTLYEKVFISMWAVNKVGLTSPVIHSLFTLIDGGDMELVRRCSSHSCLGHCVCAPPGEKCVDASKQCNDITNDNRNSLLVVMDVVDFNFPAATRTPTYTFSNTALAAEWKIVKFQNKTPQWYEWSIGYSANSSPKGVFQETEQFWFDAGQRMQMAASLPREKHLEEGGRYSFFLRAWYDSQTFAVFRSPGLTVESKPPQTTNLLGKSVKEHVKGRASEIDYIKDTNGFFVDWLDKFIDKNSLEKFQLYISRYPQGHDVHVVDASVDPNITQYDLSEYEFEPDVTYYTNVIAYNYAGLHTTVVSDGFRLDTKPPIVGIVLDGSGPGDAEYQNSSTFLAATWHGFEDLESGVMRYSWCVTSKDNLTGCDIIPLQDVHLNTKVEGMATKLLQTGTSLVHKVIATDVAGHASNISESNGVVIDATPPIRKQKLDFEENLVLNPSFESFDDSTAMRDVETHKTCSGNIIQNWFYNLSSCAYIISSNDSLANDGDSFVIIKGSILQDIVNISVGTSYRFIFYTSHLPFEGTDIISNEGYIKFGNYHRVFLLYNRPQTSSSGRMNDMFPWHKHTFYFTGHQEKSYLEIGSYAGSAGFALNDLHMQAVALTKDGDLGPQGHVTAHTVFLYDWSSIHAEWDFYDPESPIIDYMWAVGNTEGGTQLQNFQSVGTETFAFTSSLHLTHNSKVHITVVATNAAGLKTVSYSDPIIIDLTQPVFDYVNDGKGSDVDYQTSAIIEANWVVSDPESNVQSCQWAIGLNKYGTDIQDFTDVDVQKTSSLRDFTDGHLIGLTVYNTIRCKNNAGLTTTHTSDGVYITQSVLPAPGVSIEVLGASKTEYPVQDSFFSDPTSVRLRWTGFQEGTGIGSFLVDLESSDMHLSEIVLGEVDSYTYATFQGLHLMDGVYTIAVTGINEAKTYSEKICTNITLFTQKPVPRNEDLRMTWDNVSEVVTISWDGLFQSQYPLYYEVSIGFTPSSANILQWQETKNTFIVFTLPRNDVGESGRRVYASVRAIAVNGLFGTINSDTFITI